MQKVFPYSAQAMYNPSRGGQILALNVTGCLQRLKEFVTTQ
jgi:hypothetical protein